MKTPSRAQLFLFLSLALPLSVSLLAGLLWLARRDAPPPWIYASTPLPPTEARGGRPLLMVLGDSLAAGWMDCRAGCEGVEYNWPGLALGDQAWVFNRGIGNSTSADLLARWEQDTAGAEVLLVIIGVNDFARGVPTEALLANLEAMRARAEAQGQAIFFSTVWPAATTPPERQTELAALNAELLRRGQDSGWGVIDLYTPLSDPDHPGRLRPEEIAHPGSAHPNQAGYARAAAALEQAWP